MIRLDMHTAIIQRE